MRINNNITALNTHRLLNVNNRLAAKSMEKLSSGKRINRSADDAAGMAISEKMRAQIDGLKMASRNSMDGISLVQTAEGAMGEIHSMLQRMRELAVQASNGTMSDDDKMAAQQEINQLTSEINGVANRTEFNTKSILKGNLLEQSKTITNAMSTGKPATYVASVAINDDLALDALGDLSSKTLTININGEDKKVNLSSFDGAGSTRKDLIDSLNEALGEDANATFVSDGTNEYLEIRTSKSAGDANVKISGDAASILFGYNRTTMAYVSTVAINDDAALNALGDLSSKNLKINVNGVDKIVDLSPFTGSGATREEFINSINAGLGDDAEAMFIKNGTNEYLEIKAIGGGEVTIIEDASPIVFGSINTTELYVSTVAINDDSSLNALGDLSTKSLIINVNGVDKNVDLSSFNGTGGTRNDLIDLINTALGSSAEAVFVSDGADEHIEIRPIGGGLVTASGDAATTLLGALNSKDMYITTVAINDDAMLNSLGDISKKELILKVGSVDKTVDLSPFTGKGATRSEFVDAINAALGSDAEAMFVKDGLNEYLAIKPQAGVNVTIAKSPEALLSSLIFGTINLNSEYEASGSAESGNSISTGSFLFTEMPDVGSTITIGEQKIEFYDSTNGPYLGFNMAIDLKGKSSIEDVVDEIVAKDIDGVNISKDTGKVTTGINNPNRIHVSAKTKGFDGNLIYLEGTPKQFVANLQIGANTGQAFRLEVGDIRAKTLKISSDNMNGNPGVIGAKYSTIPNVTNGVSAGKVEYAIDVIDPESAEAAIKVFDNAIMTVSGERAILGATQNRLEHTVTNLENTNENLTAALSRVEDTDMALEMAEYTKISVLQQAGTAMLQKANQLPQMVLQLLQG